MASKSISETRLSANSTSEGCLVTHMGVVCRLVEKRSLFLILFHSNPNGRK
jgi:hypothetical protein